MELYLHRAYFATGTNGKLSINHQLVCETIELPWRNNRKNISCIPEGRYQLVKRTHHEHGEQLSLLHVPNREAILIHPANFALRELQGCIAPVSKITGAGTGDYSRVAMERLRALVEPVLEAGEQVFLTIKSVK